MKISTYLISGIVSCTVSFATVASAQDAAPTEEQAPPSSGIIFLKPPDRPLLGSGAGTTTPTTTTLPTVSQTPLPEVVTQQPLPDQPSNSRFASLEDEVYVAMNGDPTIQIMQSADFSIREVGLTPRYEINMSGENVPVPNQMVTSLELNPAIFGTLNYIELDMTLLTEQKWEPGDLIDGNLAVQSLQVQNIALVWGGISFYGDGELEVNGAGQINGTIRLTFTSWNSSMKLESLVGPQATGIEILLSVLTTGDALTLPIEFDQGVVKIGQQVLGILPPLG